MKISPKKAWYARMYYIKHRTRHPTDRRYRRRQMLRRLIIVAVCMLAAIMLLNARLRPIASDIVTARVQSRFAAAAAQSAADARLGAPGSLINISRLADGSVAAVETDTERLNAVKADMTARLLAELTRSDAQPLTVSLGTLTGLAPLAGRGPRVEMRLELRGGVEADIVSSLVEQGINQSLHRISCVLSAEYYVILPGYRCTVRAETVVPLAESVIVGAVPDAYTFVVGDQSDTIGRIFDYGAEN